MPKRDSYAKKRDEHDENMGFQFHVSKQLACDTIGWVERTLVDSRMLSLPSKRKLD